MLYSEGKNNNKKNNTVVSEITQRMSANPQYFSLHALAVCTSGEPNSFLWEQQCSQVLPYAVWVPSFRSSKELTAWPGRKKQNNLHTQKEVLKVLFRVGIKDEVLH